MHRTQAFPTGDRGGTSECDLRLDPTERGWTVFSFIFDQDRSWSRISGAGKVSLAGGFMAVTFTLNGKSQTVEVDPQMPLLWVLRDVFNLTGTKFGCGMALCGACTVHVDAEATRSCVTPVGSVAGKRVTTIEGISSDSTHPLQRAWLELDVPQCGYCQSGQLMSAAVLLSKNPQPSDAEIDDAMRGHICRCGTYHRIRLAIHRAARLKNPQTESARAGAGAELLPTAEF